MKEKQKAVGVQPMLFFCFPITELIADVPLLGRTAKTNEYSYFEINNNNSFVFFEITKIFGMLSPNHRFDILEILNLLLQIFENKT
ncbi:MAG: R.Pab1 family restriction endonuclease [Candidatus Kapabacteria bacterium]|nr:R.Pab1 family restriction endonuclease [Candidatus Kapabacteria bacterium]